MAAMPAVLDNDTSFDPIMVTRNHTLDGACTLPIFHQGLVAPGNVNNNMGTSECLVSISPGTGLTTTTTTAFPVPSTGGSNIHQTDLMSYWGLEEGSQPYYLDSLLVGNEMDLDELNLSFLSATGEYPIQVPSRDETQSPQRYEAPVNSAAVPGHGLRVDLDTKIQRSWHTYCVSAPSGRVTPEPRQDHCRVDEECHRQLTRKLEPRIQHGILPSTSFLVRLHGGPCSQLPPFPMPQSY